MKHRSLAERSRRSMKPEIQLQALWAAIEHWHNNFHADPAHITLGVEACPLCHVYWMTWHSCEAPGATCPIATDGHPHCAGTPYNDVAILLPDSPSETRYNKITGKDEYVIDSVDPNEVKRACQAEIEYLVSLLPDPTTGKGG